MADSARVTNVSDHTYGSELEADAAAAATSLVVSWTNDFAPDGGQLCFGDDPANPDEIVAYTIPVDAEGNPSETAIDLAIPLVNSYVAGDKVWVYPKRVERWAYYFEPGGENPLPARVPIELVPYLPEGARTDDAAEQIEVTERGVDQVVLTVVGQPARQDLNSVLLTTSLDGTGQRVEIDDAGIRLIDADEDVLANLPTDDTQTPTFAGHVAAKGGVDIDAGDSGTPPDSRKVRWLRTADGGVVAELFANHNVGTTPVFHINVPYGTGVADSVQSEIALAALGRGADASIVVVGSPSGDPSSIKLNGGSVQSGGIEIRGPGDVSDFEFDVSDGWQDWPPTLTGWSANPTNSVYRYKQEGKRVTLTIRQATSGTSNSVSKSISLPVTAATIANMAWSAPCRATDNGTDLVAPSNAQIASGATAIDFAKTYDATSGGWTNPGAHRIRTCQIVYECV